MIIGGEKMDILKKTLQFGFGLAHIGKEHMQALMKDLKDKYNLDENQSKKLAKDIIKHSIDAHKEIKNVVKKHFNDLVEEEGLKKEDKPAPKKPTAKNKSPTKKKPAKTTKKTATKKTTTKSKKK